MLQEQVLKLAENRLRRQGIPVALELWNGKRIQLAEMPQVTVRINRSQALMHLAKPSLGKLAQSYVHGDIDLEGATRDILVLGQTLCDEDVRAGTRRRIGLPWWKRARQSKRRARENVSYHYDVSNEFYALWLDSRRVYSCAYFRQPDDTLERAQEQKLEHICRKLDLKPGERLLDIGCGWGGLVMWAAEHYRVRATGITLSQNQFDFAREQIKARGLESLIDIHLMDYRDVPETEPFDKIASVGMFEHVGREHLGTYFRKIYRLLKPGGLVMNHGITASGFDTQGLGSGISDFVDRYVFPGGELVHVSEVIEAMSRQGLECWDAECLRPHYARTLWHWVDRLEAHSEAAKRLVGEERYRIWRIYMAGSAHAFDHGWLSIFQLLGGRPLPDGRLPYPLTRDHVYR